MKIETGMARQTPPNPSHRQRREPPERELGGFPPLASRERARGAARSKLLRTPELACARHVPGTIWHNGVPEMPLMSNQHRGGDYASWGGKLPLRAKRGRPP